MAGPVPLISAHRGGLAADGVPAADRYRHAIDLGVDFVEFDVRKTSDGLMVIYHDDRTASGRYVRDLDYRDLAGELGPEALTLDQLLDVAAGRVGLHLDLKETGYEAEVVRAVLDRSPLDRLVITSGDEAIRTIKERFPAVTAGLTIGEDINGLSPWLKLRTRLSELYPRERIERSHADFIAVHQQLAGLTGLRYCKRHGLPAWVWTVDDEPGIRRFLADPRVTTLITNRPDLALSIATSISAAD